MSASTTIDTFLSVDIRVGRVIQAEEFPRARKPAYKLWIDFGELGARKSIAQITDLYTTAELKGRLVLGCGESAAAPSRRLHLRSTRAWSA
jgi:tRNA-binding protein